MGEPLCDMPGSFRMLVKITGCSQVTQDAVGEFANLIRERHRVTLSLRG